MYIQAYSASLKHIHAYWGIIKAYSGLFRYIKQPLQPSHIHNLDLFQALAYLELKAYSKTCHSHSILSKHYSAMFRQTLYFRSLAGIRPSLNKYSLSWGVTQHNALYEKTFRVSPIIVNSNIFRHTQVLFRHIQPYCGILRILCSSCIFRTLPYLESWHS